MSKHTKTRRTLAAAMAAGALILAAPAGIALAAEGDPGSGGGTGGTTGTNPGGTTTVAATATTMDVNAGNLLTGSINNSVSINNSGESVDLRYTESAGIGLIEATLSESAGIGSAYPPNAFLGTVLTVGDSRNGIVRLCITCR
jgi:hypothetical protein